VLPAISHSGRIGFGVADIDRAEDFYGRAVLQFLNQCLARRRSRGRTPPAEIPTGTRASDKKTIDETAATARAQGRDRKDIAMAQRVLAARLAGTGPDAVPGWYLISFEEVTGLQSGDRKLEVLMPSVVAASLAHQITEHLPHQAPKGQGGPGRGYKGTKRPRLSHT
jgi:hypothetical protein